jgi:hypothetical protein
MSVRRFAVLKTAVRGPELSTSLAYRLETRDHHEMSFYGYLNSQ